jgi:hypothetical protein
MKKVWRVVISLILLLALVGVISFFIIRPHIDQTIAAINESSNISVSACSNPSNPLNLSANESEDCYAGIAEVTGNSSFCYLVQNENLRMNCAINLNDSVLCDGIQDTTIKELCYAQMSVCYKIREPNLKNQCFATARNDTSYCANVREDIRVYPCS